MEDTPKFCYVYPIYFDSERACSEGRRLPKNFCKKNPQARELFQASQSLSFSSELQIDKSHPRSVNGSGRIKIEFDGKSKKNQILAMIAEKLIKMPASSLTATESSKTSSKAAVELAPNVVYEMRPKKNKKNK